MKTLTTQYPSPPGKFIRRLLPALLVALLSLCAVPSSGQMPTTWTIGTGTSVYGQTGTPISPLGYYYPIVRVNYLYDSTSLKAAGMPLGGGTVAIHQIAFNVGNLYTASGPANYSIGIANSNLMALPTTGGFVGGIGGLPIHYSGTFNPTTGWNVITLNTPFIWNGTGGILLEMCWNNGNAYGAAQAGVQYHSSSTGVKSVYSYGLGPATFCGSPTAPMSNTTNRPNIQFTNLVPCTGKPQNFTTTPNGTISTLCPGTRTTLIATGHQPGLGIRYQWWTASTATGPWSHAQGDSASDRYTTPPLVSNTYYRLVMTCINTGDSTVSNTVPATAPNGTPVAFTFPGGFPTYGSLPYFESFENWGNGCATNDKISSNNWTNIPATGVSSWRREDQGASASWSNPTAPSPPATYIDGSHAARWHGYTAPPGDGGAGVLQLYVNTSATANAKDLSFYYYFQYATPQPTYPMDSIVVDYSTDGGATWSLPIAKIGYTYGPQQTWNLVTVPNIPVSSPTTVFRFKAKRGTTSSYQDDIYIDAVRIDPPCIGKPVAGQIDTIIACAGKPFKLKLKNNVPAAGLSYQWQYKAPSAMFWSPLPGGNQASPTTSFSTPTDFRAIVTCTNTTPNLSDTTPVYRAYPAPFYFCYCDITVSPTYNNGTWTILLGNVTLATEPAGVILLNNGNPLPTIGNTSTVTAPYEDFRLTVPAPTLILDSSYKIFLTQTQHYAYWYPYGYGVAWLDANRNGMFEASERIIHKPITNQMNPTVSNVFTIPPTSGVGLTGLRTVNSYYYSGTGINPCGQQYAYGQAEDYLVRIEYQPCTGPVNPGTAWASDSVMCPGYTVDLYDTSYEKTRTNILRMWEVSTNGGASFSAIPGSAQKDTMTNVTVTATSQFRLRVICGPSGDTTYSNPVTVRAPEPVRCYPVSWAAPGGGADSSDIGSFIIGNFVNPDSTFPAGPHLNNPLAVKRRTDYTTMTPMIELHADSTYRLGIFHTMPRGFHSDALISVYIDFNNDLDYDQFVSGPPFTSELIFQGKTDKDSFFLFTTVKMPNGVIPNVPTGMRVVLNNDLNPTGPGNRGAGAFTSGEVEDYVVVFRRPNLSAGAPALLQNLALYPNPTEGKFTVLSDAARPVNQLDVVVSTITGQQVYSRTFDNVGTHFSTNLDLSSQAKGIYFVEIRADGEKITKKLVIR